MPIQRSIPSRQMGRRHTDSTAVARSTSRSGASKTKGLNSTRGRILASAEQLFAKRGFSSVSMPMIAHKSGITAGAIYKHFESKADLFFEVVRRAVQATSVSTAVESPSDSAALPTIVANYTTRRLRLLRQLAVEVHYASARHREVRRFLRQSLDRQIRQIGDYLATGQRAGKFDPTADAELLACTILVFIMGLMHMETLLPRLVGDTRWRDFVRDRAAALVAVPTSSKSHWTVKS